MGSYASEVKKELTGLSVHPEHAKAELSAFLRMNGVLNLNQHHLSLNLSLIHISEPTRLLHTSRMPSSA